MTLPDGPFTRPQKHIRQSQIVTTTLQLKDAIEARTNMIAQKPTATKRSHTLPNTSNSLIKEKRNQIH